MDLNALLALSATPIADRWGLYARRTAADDLHDLGYGGGGTTTAQDPAEDLDDEDAPDPTTETDPTATATDDPERQPVDDAEDAVDHFGETEASDPTYKKRFVRSQEVHVQDKRRMQALEEQLASMRTEFASLKASLPLTTRASETADSTRTETGRRLYDEVRAVEGKDEAEKTQRVYETIEQRIVETAKQTEARLLQKAQQQEAQRIRAEAEANMVAALEARGLSPKLLGTVDKLVDELKATDPGWFQRTPVKDHFTELAKMTYDLVRPALKEDAIRANEQHRRSATGVMGSTSRTTRTRSARDAEEVPDQGFSAQLTAMRQAAIQRGTAMAKRG